MFLLTLENDSPVQGSCKINGSPAEYRRLADAIEWRHPDGGEWSRRKIVSRFPAGSNLTTYVCEDADGSDDLAILSSVRATPALAITCFDRGHEWVVFSTALAEVWLMLQCVACGRMGTVEDPTTEEWSEAFHAPSRPYVWADAARVNVREVRPLHVTRASGRQGCRCHELRGLPEVGAYERIPGEITSGDEVPDASVRAEVRELADFVAGTNLCSALFPDFVRYFQEDTGARHSAAVNQVAGRIRELHDAGLHFSPSAIAKTLRDFAGP